MFAEQFKKYEADKTSAILNAVNPHLDLGALDTAQTVVLGVKLPFYKDYHFLDISDYSQVPAVRVFIVYNPKTSDVRLLNWSNEPIYALNKDAPIALSEKKCLRLCTVFPVLRAR
ncbi:MAG: hypothetical protein LRZ85_05395 [Alphaproteobacteria bacterium]|nr:hypothetical protein [Alphaproteobacteria bacterium]